MPERNRTIAAPLTHETVIKKSRFICHLGRATTDDEARAFIAERKRIHWDANHNCSAWVIGPHAESQRSSDDGEPSGTAGAPMLNAINQRDLTGTVAVVTRYFGGTLLGAGGLIRAYGHAVSAAIDLAGIVERRPLQVIEVEASHEDAGRLDFALRGTSFPLASVAYGASATFTLHLDEADLPAFESWLSEATAGRCHARRAGVRIVEIPITGR